MSTPRPIDWDVVARHLCDLVTKPPTADDFTLSPPPPDDEFAWLGDDVRADLASILRDVRPKWEAEVRAMGVSLQQLVDDQCAEIITVRTEPPPPAPKSAAQQLREWHDTIRAMEPPPPPRTLEVGWLAHARLRLLARQPDGPIARRFNTGVDLMTGIPIVERDDLAPDAWRVMEGDNAIKEGTL